jgi:hypothetical protein
MSNKTQRKEYIHTFTVTLSKTVPETTPSTNEAGEKVTITKDVVKEVPVEILIKNPSRSLREDGDLFYAATFSDCLRRGIFSEAMLAKQFKEIGTTLSEEEKLRYRKLVVRYAELENEIQRASLKDEKEAKEKAIIEQNEIRDELVDFRASQNALFNNTADTIARNKTIMWYLLHLGYYKQDDKIVPLFPGETFVDKSESYDKAEETGDEIVLAASDELTSFITFWYLGMVKDSDEFAAIKKSL